MNGQTLRAIRRDLKLTQTELGRLLGIHLVTISNWERGKREIPQAIALAVKQIQVEAA